MLRSRLDRDDQNHPHRARGPVRPARATVIKAILVTATDAWALFPLHFPENVLGRLPPIPVLCSSCVYTDLRVLHMARDKIQVETVQI